LLDAIHLYISGTFMEVTLNLVWLLVAFGMAVAWRDHWLSRWRRFAPLGAVALGVALVLLFPEISITDDLHAEQAVMEESSRSVMKARDAAQRCLSAARHTIHFAALVRPGLSATVWIAVGRMPVPEVPLLHWALVYPSEGRSPPCFES
jgi:hypothetical protein